MVRNFMGTMMRDRMDRKRVVPVTPGQPMSAAHVPAAAIVARAILFTASCRPPEINKL